MTVFKRTLSTMLVLILILSISISVEAATDQTDALITSIINYFQYYQGDARTDYDLLLEQLRGEDPALADTWSGIVDFWIHLNDGLDVRQPVLPDGLPDDDSLCIAVMGYYLKPDGGMRAELYSRLEVALASAQKYPNAYILCTGGGSKMTEAEQMARWLKKQGIAEDRIIIEKKATSTIENATYGCAMLYRDYPQVTTLGVITSDYHIYRSCLYFNTQAALDAYSLGTEPMKVIAAATCVINPKAPTDVDTQVEGICILTDLEALDLPKPKLSTLDSIRISGPAECAVGEEPELLVSATYSNGYSREVTEDVTFSGIDFGSDGIQTVTATYEGKTATLDIRFLPAAEPVTEAPTEATAPTEAVPEILPEEPEPSDLTVAGIIAAVCLLLLAILVILKKRQAKRRRRPKPVIKLD